MHFSRFPLIVLSVLCIVSACTTTINPPTNENTSSSISLNSSSAMMDHSSVATSANTASISSNALTECSWEDCKPAMGMPNWQCPDGTTGGPNCVRKQNGVCGWTIHQCASSSSDLSSASSSSPITADCLCPSTLAWDATTKTCIAKGQSMCPQYMKPGGFCGCDGKTYANNCYAAQAGVRYGKDCAAS